MGTRLIDLLRHDYQLGNIDKRQSHFFSDITVIPFIGGMLYSSRAGRGQRTEGESLLRDRRMENGSGYMTGRTGLSVSIAMKESMDSSGSRRCSWIQTRW